VYMLANLDRFREFRHWICMPFEKIEVLTNILINWGYIDPPRSHCCRAEFCKHSELLVMLALYLLGTSAGFCSCRALCHISISEVRLFYYRFIDAMVDTKDEYISLPQNLTELDHVNLFRISHKPPAGSLKVLHAPARRGGIWRAAQTKIYNLETDKFVSNPPFLKILTKFWREQLELI
jgi:hypothetical protein